MQGLIGQKIGMTRVFDKDSGQVVPVTVIQTGSNMVHQVKTVEKDGYAAAQLGFGNSSERSVTKPCLGHMKKHGGTTAKVLKEFALDGSEVQAGQTVGVEVFEEVAFVDVTGTSKGRGFAGTVRRHNFQRGRETHGNTNHRAPGSIGACSYPARVFPGQKMAGQYGNAQVTKKRLKLIGVDKESGVLLVHGAVPGRTNGVVFVRKNSGKK